MDLYVIRRRNAWATPEELSAAGARSAEEGDKANSGVRWIRTYVVEEDDGRRGRAPAARRSAGGPRDGLTRDGVDGHRVARLCRVMRPRMAIVCAGLAVGIGALVAAWPFGCFRAAGPMSSPTAASLTRPGVS